jgi:hypothetical protein
VQPAKLDAFGGKKVAQHPATREREVHGSASIRRMIARSAADTAFGR